MSPSPPIQPPRRRVVLVCQNRSCLRSDADQVLAAFQQRLGPSVLVSSSECLGQCGSGPTVKVMPDDIWYCRVKPADVDDIVDQHWLGDKPVQRLLHPRFHPQYGAYAEAAKTPSPPSPSDP